jgi:hypothetical protein
MIMTAVIAVAIAVAALLAYAARKPDTFMGKLMGLFMNCDKMVGGQFEEGLSKLKKLVETPPAVAAE